MSRNKFLNRSLQAAVGTFFVAPLLASARSFRNDPSASVADVAGSAPTDTLFKQVPLPYAFDALEPHIDKQTMEIHYMKHHAAYVKNVAAAIAEENITASSEADFFANVSKYSAKARNNGGGAWNHNLYWQVMKPNGGGTPSGKVLDALNGAFGDFGKFKEKFAEVGMKRFGSGWAWLLSDAGKLNIGSTPNQDNPLMDVSDLHGTPLLGMDVWEHAYYLKCQNKRDEYIANFWNVVSWDEVAKRLG